MSRYKSSDPDLIRKCIEVDFGVEALVIDDFVTAVGMWCNFNSEDVRTDITMTSSTFSSRLIEKLTEIDRADKMHIWSVFYKKFGAAPLAARERIRQETAHNAMNFVKFWSMEALSIFQQVNTGQRECGHDTRHSAFSTKKLFSCIYPDALASYALVVTLLKKRSVPLQALANEHMTASLCKFRRYIDQNSLGEPPPTEWRSLYKDKLKRLLDETESHLRRLTAIAEVLGMGN
ncbi:hypothetical protein T03_17693 [Trichinella britovi]|uniref:Uncharacterized protein n=2 Tax=Trichinella TaxID=6333 RepID=A0A0V1CME8_TRIBR|nr:hypothetical protein T03_17693 [Trichinella britovi]